MTPYTIPKHINKRMLKLKLKLTGKIIVHVKKTFKTIFKNWHRRGTDNIIAETVPWCILKTVVCFASKSRLHNSSFQPLYSCSLTSSTSLMGRTNYRTWVLAKILLLCLLIITELSPWTALLTSAVSIRVNAGQT